MEGITMIDPPICAMSLILTENCCAQCSYCFCGEKYQRDISEETARRAIDWLLSDETSGLSEELRVDFWGGEPLMRLDLIKQLIPYARAQARKLGKQISFNMTTNGVLLNASTLDYLLDQEIGFMISLDGLKEIQNKNRPLVGGQGSYDIIAKNLQHIFAKVSDAKVRMTITADDAHRYHENVIHLHELGFARIASSPAFETDWDEERMEAYRQSIFKLADWYMEQFRQPKARIPAIKLFEDQILRMASGDFHQEKRHLCGAGRRYVTVDIDGAIHPCHRFVDFGDCRSWTQKEYVLGHIDHGLVNTSLHDQFLKPVCVKDATESTGCTLCYGGTGCYYVNLMQAGDMHHLPMLQVKEIQYRLEVALSIYNTMMLERNKRFADYYRRVLRSKGGRGHLPLAFNHEGCPVSDRAQATRIYRGEKITLPKEEKVIVADVIKATAKGLQITADVMADRLMLLQKIEELENELKQLKGATP
jgi:uncharacterized protein